MDAPLPFRRAVLMGGGALLLPTLLGVGARLFGADEVLAIVILVLGVIGGIAMAIVSLRGERIALVIAAVIVIVIAPIGALVLVEARPVGPVLRLPVEEASRRWIAAGVIPTDGAAPRGDLQERVTVVETWFMRRGGPGRRQDTYFVAPVVPPGWTQDRPVHAVALVGSRSEVRAPEARSIPWAPQGGLLRLLDGGLQDRAVRQALQRRGLTPAPGMVIGSWVPSPGWARLEAVLPALAVLGTGWLAWTVILVLDRLRAAPRRGRR